MAEVNKPEFEIEEDIDENIQLSEPWLGRVMDPVVRFLHIEASSGVVLLIATMTALILANTSTADAFLNFWKTDLTLEVGSFHFSHSLQHLINDGLMVIFFFVVGLEVKRELAVGELREFRRAILPLAAAIGGMIIPASIYLLVQKGAAHGWGIPMATDIAFVVGCMAILGRRVPHGLRVMLLTLAIADDVGAILVIAIGYTAQLHWLWLGIGIGSLALVGAMRLLGVRSFGVYTIVGIVIWYAFLESGIHATIAGVILGLMTPATNALPDSVMSKILRRAKAAFDSGSFRANPARVERLRWLQSMSRETVSPLEYLIHALHPWVSFVIMPLFALANAGVPIHLADVHSPVAMAVAAGLFIGKPVGIVLACFLVVKFSVAELPSKVTWVQVLGGGILCGIGFTMALFIAGLATSGPLLDIAKVGVMAGSAISALLGMIVLYKAGQNTPFDPEHPHGANH